MKHTHLRHLGIVLGASALLAGCGGGNSGAEVAPRLGSHPVATDARVPASATLSAKGAVAFIRTLETDEEAAGDSLHIDAADLGTSETDEPEPDA